MDYTIKQLKAAECSGFKYYTRLEKYKGNNGNCVFYADRVHGYSYGWWTAVEKIGPFVIFNACLYSNQTAKHLGKMRSVMRALGIKIDFAVYASGGLQRLVGEHQSGHWRGSYASSALDHYLYEIKTREALILKPRTHKQVNELRRLELVELRLKVSIVKALQRLRTAKGAKRSTLVNQLRALKVQLTKAERNTGALWTKHYEARAKRRAAKRAERAAAASVPVQHSFEVIQGGVA